MKKKGKIGNLLQRRMSNKIGHGARRCRQEFGVMSPDDLQTDLRMGLGQRGRPWAEMKAVGHGILGVWENGKIKHTILEVIPTTAIFTILAQGLKKKRQKGKREVKPKTKSWDSLHLLKLGPGNN